MWTDGPSSLRLLSSTVAEIKKKPSSPLDHTAAPSRASLKSLGNLLTLYGFSTKRRKFSMETVQTGANFDQRGRSHVYVIPDSQNGITTSIVWSVLPHF